MKIMPNRRLFLSYFSGLGVAETALPSVLWGSLQEQKSATVTRDMLRTAAAASGLSFSDQQLDRMLEGVNRNLANYEKLRKVQLDNSVAPPFYFNPVVPGMK